MNRARPAKGGKEGFYDQVALPSRAGVVAGAKTQIDKTLTNELQLACGREKPPKRERNFMKLVKIGSIIKSGSASRRINIMWDGECLCTSDGSRIPDGEVKTLEEAKSLSAWLWSGSVWHYQQV